MHCVLSIAFVAIAAVTAGNALAQRDYPAKPIRLIVPFAPGGPSDILARTVAQKLTDRVEGAPGERRRGRGRQHARAGGGTRAGRTRAMDQARKAAEINYRLGKTELNITA